MILQHIFFVLFDMVGFHLVVHNGREPVPIFAIDNDEPNVKVENPPAGNIIYLFCRCAGVNINISTMATNSALLRIQVFLAAFSVSLYTLLRMATTPK